MATIPDLNSSSAFPSCIHMRDSGKSEEFSGLSDLCPESLRTLIRNEFFLPLYKSAMAPNLQKDQEAALTRMQGLTDLSILCSPQLKVVREFFSVRDVPVCIEGTTLRTFIVRLFESKQPVHGKKLRIILFSYNVNKESSIKDKIEKRWDPLTVKDLSNGPLSVLKAMGESGIKVDSVVTASLGNMLFARAIDLVGPEQAKVIPRTIVINRGMTSVQKVVNKLYSRPLNYFLYFLAKFSGWDADPEKELIGFLEKNKKTKRKVMVIEAQEDYYFSREGAFGENFHTKIIHTDAKVFRASFYPYPFHPRAHHALSLEYFENTTTTNVSANTIPLSFAQQEKVTSVIARELLHKGTQQWHTCFYVAGNDATLDTGGIRDIVPLAYEFIQEGQKLEQKDQKLRSFLTSHIEV